ncbi:hypothetical protein BJ138DRAFT_139933 [Hygrophoropsis aurantiaca]|uniref:Uncharacterized protein n=1 Tax=Hygrophoropsis aurantiaca TaxID=72124 RepID=A0ACB7ZQV8_9AGAM|nr:hypothetical protein BJ138DRAFT_139933 [Hygrophoropsis aurantiaca]
MGIHTIPTLYINHNALDTSVAVPAKSSLKYCASPLPPAKHYIPPTIHREITPQSENASFSTRSLYFSYPRFSRHCEVLILWPPRDQDTFTLYLYKGYDCTGTVLKHKLKPVDGVCRNLPVPTKNKKGQSEGPNWNDRVKSLNIVLPDGASLKMFRDQGCKNEYGQTLGGWWAVPNMTREVWVNTEINFGESFPVYKKLGGMSSYLVPHIR